MLCNWGIVRIECEESRKEESLWKRLSELLSEIEYVRFQTLFLTNINDESIAKAARNNRRDARVATSRQQSIVSSTIAAKANTLTRYAPVSN